MLKEVSNKFKHAYQNDQKVTVRFGLIEKLSKHPQIGPSMVYFDQLQLIRKRLKGIKECKYWKALTESEDMIYFNKPIEDETFADLRETAVTQKYHENYNIGKDEQTDSFDNVIQ